MSWVSQCIIYCTNGRHCVQFIEESDTEAPKMAEPCIILCIILLSQLGYPAVGRTIKYVEQVSLMVFV